jgi:hypothetical protein
MMITFETQADFEAAVLQVVIDKLDIKVFARGYPFMTGVEVALANVADVYGGVLISGSDAVA